MEDVCRNFSAKINNLFASSKLEILIGDKSGIIKFPWESSYIVNFGWILQEDYISAHYIFLL